MNLPIATHAGATSLTPCVSIAVLGLFSSDDEVKPDHFYYKPANKRLNSISVTGRDEVFEYIINHFSQPNSVVLDISCSQGMNMHVSI